MPKPAKRRAPMASPAPAVVFEKKYPIPEAAEIFGCASKTLSNYVSEGRVGCYRFGW